jgi:regulator of CtrA degradation
MRNSVESTLPSGSVTVSFGERFQASEQFDQVFKEGMALVERTAAYLEGPGRAEAKRLAAPANVLYAAESMRLTTRLLDLASWLLIRRAIKEGELSEAEAQAKRRNVTLQSPARAAHVQGFSSLPKGLQVLVEESDALNERIVRLDRALNVKLDDLDEAAAGDEPLPANPVGLQLNRLRVAFSN